jgi:hypothetical protein
VVLRHAIAATGAPGAGGGRGAAPAAAGTPGGPEPLCEIARPAEMSQTTER